MCCCSYVSLLFDILLVSNQFSGPEYVWSKTWEHLSDGVLYRQRMILRVQDLVLHEDQLKSYALE